MHPKRILIIGNYGAGNLGDDAILGGILTDLKAIGYQGKIEIMHGGIHTSPEIYKGLKKVPFIPTGLRSRLRRKTKKAAHAAIRRADLVIFGGGGLFVDSESWRAPYLWAMQARACHKWNTPYIIYGQSVGPLNRYLSRCWARASFQGAKAIHVRDEASLRWLKKIGVKKAHLGSDVALSWLNEQREKTKKSPFLVVCIRHWNAHINRLWLPILPALKSFALRHKLELILLPMDLGNKQEIKAMRQLGATVLEKPSAKEAFDVFQNAKMAVSMRLHGGLFALMARLPFISLAYTQKVSSQMKTLNIKGGFQLIELKHFKERQLKRKLKMVYKNGGPQFNLEAALMNNQSFLTHALWD